MGYFFGDNAGVRQCDSATVLTDSPCVTLLLYDSGTAAVSAEAVEWEREYNNTSLSGIM